MGSGALGTLAHSLARLAAEAAAHSQWAGAERLQYIFFLPQGKVYEPKLLPPVEGNYGPNYTPGGMQDVLPAAQQA